MFSKLISLKTRALSFIQNEDGVVAWEYLLVIAGVSVAVIAAIALGATPLINAVIDGTCGAMQTIMPSGVLTCS